MIIFSERVHIRRDPEDVYTFLARPENIMAYAPYLDRVEGDPPGELKTGSVVTECGQFRGGAAQTEWSVVEAVQGKHIVFETSNFLSKLARVHFQTNPMEGGTDLIVEVKVVTHLRYRLAEFFIKRRLIRLRKIELGRIKDILESDN